MFKYIIKSFLKLIICAAVIIGIAAAFGAEFKLLSENDNILSYAKINDSEGRLSLGQYNFTVDLNLIGGAKAKLSEFANYAVSYVPELALKAGEYFINIKK